ncbi:Unknown protein, partial [Striga hermonthica]
SSRCGVKRYPNQWPAVSNSSSNSGHLMLDLDRFCLRTLTFRLNLEFLIFALYAIDGIIPRLLCQVVVLDIGRRRETTNSGADERRGLTAGAPPQGGGRSVMAAALSNSTFSSLSESEREENNDQMASSSLTAVATGPREGRSSVCPSTIIDAGSKLSP